MMRGRPSCYSEDNQAKADEYLENYEAAGDMVPQVAGVAKICGVCEKTIYNWGDAHPDFLQTLSKIQTEQHRVLVNKGLSGDFSGPVSKLMLSNHGHSERTATEITGANGGPVAVQEIQFIPVDNND